MRHRLQVIALTGVFTGALAYGSFALSQSPTPWKAPAYAARKKNPVAPTADSIQRGKALYAQFCKACHGEGAKGDGPAGKYLRPPAADLTSRRTRSQADGELFWKIEHGRSPMPRFRGQLEAKQIWDLVNFLRSLAPRIRPTENDKEGEHTQNDTKPNNK